MVRGVIDYELKELDSDTAASVLETMSQIDRLQDLQTRVEPLLRQIQSLTAPLEVALYAFPNLILGCLQTLLLHPDFSICVDRFGVTTALEYRYYSLIALPKAPSLPATLANNPSFLNYFENLGRLHEQGNFNESNRRHHDLLYELVFAAKNGSVEVSFSAKPPESPQNHGLIQMNLTEAWHVLTTLMSSLQVAQALLVDDIDSRVYWHLEGKLQEAEYAEWERDAERFRKLELEQLRADQDELDKLWLHEMGLDQESLWEQNTYIEPDTLAWDNIGWESEEPESWWDQDADEDADRVAWEWEEDE